MQDMLIPQNPCPCQWIMSLPSLWYAGRWQAAPYRA